MDKQDEFFNFYGDIPTPKKLARSGDPVTSKLAAERAVHFLHGHHRKIYNALLAMEDGTPYEIADATGLEVAAVFRRLNEMEKLGVIYPTGETRRGPTGSLCRVWSAV